MNSMKVLVTGANGYIGLRLLPLLIEAGHEVVALVRSRRRFRVGEEIKKKITVVEGDLLKMETLGEVPGDINAAFYLIHSMAETSGQFEGLEKRCAEHFVELAKKCRMKQLIYLSGIKPEKNSSPHLRSRKQVEDILTDCGIPYTILRAGIIIGSGSASFEIIRDLVEKLPFMVAPRWVQSKCQPISIHNVLEYLTGVIGNERCLNEIFDIGGPDILTYEEMLYQYAEVRGLKRYILNVGVLTPRLSSYWLLLVTTTNFNLARSLVESMKCDLACREERIKEIIPLECYTYKQSLERTLAITAKNQVISSWKDAMYLSGLDPVLSNYIDVPKHGCLFDRKKIPLDGNRKEVIRRTWSIGGSTGWYFMNWAWSVRGFIDKAIGGVGLRRGRRNPTDLTTGDALDFWRVIIADKEEGHLLLYAEMKVPGEAWLEFKIDETFFEQTATFRPRGVLGRLYWYTLLPIHKLIFWGMAKRLAQT